MLDEPRSAKLLYLHIGLHKTGTTYLQHVMRANRDALAEQGVFFPGGEQVGQMLAVWDLFGRRPRGAQDGRINGQWAALSQLVNGDETPVALVSEEYLSLATVAQARRAVASFPGTEVHVVVTARDIGRVAVSAWQEEVKNDKTWTWDEFAAAIRDPGARARNPARGFWLRQDLPAILETWRAAVPAERIHVVTVPPPGADPAELLGRFAQLVGFDHTPLPHEPKWNNQTLGIAGTEVVRRLNERLDHRLNQRQHDRVVKLTLVPAMGRRLGSSRFGLPPDQVDWAQSWSHEALTQIDKAGYQVVGDLTDLVPVRQAGVRRPDDASTEELLEAAMTALGELAERHARAWWDKKQPDVGVEGSSRRTRMASAARGAVFRGQRRAAEVADRNAAVGRLMGRFLAARATARRRAARSD
jgi:hypothetical protein